ncbi:MAG: Uma2 family endonuclease [Saprospiraceae bacterium]
MVAISTTANAAQPARKPLRKLPAATKPITWKDFQSRYLRREDGYKYEWVKGMVEKTPRSMNQDQYFIWRNLAQFLRKLAAQSGDDLGEFLAEADTFFLNDTHRRPDIAWFSADQLAVMAYGQNQVPRFVIEVISTSDGAYRVMRKMRDYRTSDQVPVVWQIFPELLEVHVYRGGQMTICQGDDLCSAAPALPDFVLSATEVFRKPPRPEGL